VHGMPLAISASPTLNLPTRELLRMSGNYWRMIFIQPSPPDSSRCVMLYGEMDEIVGPLTVELAEAWMSRFQNSSPGESFTAAQLPSEAST
jgi:hypothetical protein